MESSYCEFTNENIACVFVLFYPDISIIKTLRLHSNAGYHVVVVSNGADSNVIDSIKKIPNISVIYNPDNFGLARALNQGIDLSFSDDLIRFVALFDQDSKPSATLPFELSCEFTDSIAAVGPMLIDIKSNFSNYNRHNLAAGNNRTETIPTSGTVISKTAFIKVGPMLNELFIDGIDHEWCFRARSKGFQIRISNKCTMVHDMGDSFLNWFGEYKPLYSNPIRHFYIIRNSVFLGLHSNCPMPWRILELFKTLRRIPLYFLKSSNPNQTIRLVAKALYDGLAGRLGPLVE